MKVGRRYTHNCSRYSVDDDSLADCGCFTVEQCFPQRVTDHDRRISGGIIVVWSEWTSHNRSDAKCGKVISGNELSGYLLGPPANIGARTERYEREDFSRKAVNAAKIIECRARK